LALHNPQSDKETLFLIVRTHIEQGIYGADPATLELTEDLGTDTNPRSGWIACWCRVKVHHLTVVPGFEVPSILKSMREALEAQDAFSQEGIFRLAGDQNEIKRLKAEMNRTKCFNAYNADPNTIANLLKVR